MPTVLKTSSNTENDEFNNEGSLPQLNNADIATPVASFVGTSVSAPFPAYTESIVGASGIVSTDGNTQFTFKEFKDRT